MRELYSGVIACLLGCWLPVSASAMAADERLVDPCTLVTNAEVEQIIGKLKGDPTSNREERTRFCIYEFVNEKDALELWVFPASGLERAKKSIKTLSPVTGLGPGSLHNSQEGYPIHRYLTKDVRLLRPMSVLVI